jgi:hypothetical protein
MHHQSEAPFVKINRVKQREKASFLKDFVSMGRDRTRKRGKRAIEATHELGRRGQSYIILFNLPFDNVWRIKVLKIEQQRDKFRLFHLKNGRDMFSKAQKFCNDGRPSAHQTKKGLPTHIRFRKQIRTIRHDSTSWREEGGETGGTREIVVENKNLKLGNKNESGDCVHVYHSTTLSLSLLWLAP